MNIRTMIRSALNEWVSRRHDARLRAFGDKPAWARVPAGFEMFIDPSDELDREFYLGTFEPAMCALIAQTVRRGDVCLDIGAQKGYVTLTLAQAVGPHGQVFSFEPDWRAGEKLKAHIDRASYGSIRIFNHALGEKEGSYTFTLSKVLGWSSRFPNELAKTAIAETAEVKFSSLDEMIVRNEISIDLTKLSFIKLDAEGSEPLILKGMANLLSAAKPVIFMEVNFDSLAAAGSSPQIVEALLQSFKMNMYRPHYRVLLRKLSLLPVTTLDSLRTSHGNFTNIVAFRGDLPRERLAALSRFIATRHDHPGAPAVQH